MHCPRCHAESRDGAKFCEDCGSRLAVRCSSCGSEVSVGKRFCGTCGHPIEHGPTEPRLAARIALDGEHKLVTVLFCDIVNSTGLAERLGAEQMHTLLNRFFERALSEVHRYEGTINQFLGDGFMALFGARPSLTRITPCAPCSRRSASSRPSASEPRSRPRTGKR